MFKSARKAYQTAFKVEIRGKIILFRGTLAPCRRAVNAAALPMCAELSSSGHIVGIDCGQSGRGARHVFDLRQKSQRFGVDNRPSCPLCRELTSLTRRSPDADYGLQHERQIFTCFRCDQTIERVVDVDGNSPA